jgi:hypothetical protein
VTASLTGESWQRQMALLWWVLMGKLAKERAMGFYSPGKAEGLHAAAGSRWQVARVARH